jgi:hypothetical protein
LIFAFLPLVSFLMLKIGQVFVKNFGHSLATEVVLHQKSL